MANKRRFNDTIIRNGMIIKNIQATNSCTTSICWTNGNCWFMDRIRSSSKVRIMEIFLLGIMIGFAVGYPMGLFIDKLDKREKAKNGGR